MITITLYDLPFIAAASSAAAVPSFDTFEAYVLSTALDGLDGGTGPWASVYTDRSLLGQNDTYDNLEGYTPGADLNGLNSFSLNSSVSGTANGTWGAGYVDNYPGIGVGATDSMESYAPGVVVIGLSGGTAYFNFWGGPYVAR